MRWNYKAIIRKILIGVVVAIPVTVAGKIVEKIFFSEAEPALTKSAPPSRSLLPVQPNVIRGNSDSAARCESEANLLRDQIGDIYSEWQHANQVSAMLVAHLLGCGDFERTFEVTNHMNVLHNSEDYDGALAMIAMTSIRKGKNEFANRAVRSIMDSKTREQLSSIFINELTRNSKCLSSEGDSDNNDTTIRISYGSLGGALYKYRTRAITYWGTCTSLNSLICTTNLFDSICYY